MIKGKNRVKAAYLTGLLVTAMKVKKDRPLLSIVMTTPYLGSVPIYPDQQTLGSGLTRVSIEGESKEIMLLRLIRTFAAINQGRPPAPGVLKFESSEQFCLANNRNLVTLDGDLQPGAPKIIEVRRSDRPFKMVALS